MGKKQGNPFDEATEQAQTRKSSDDQAQSEDAQPNNESQRQEPEKPEAPKETQETQETQEPVTPEETQESEPVETQATTEKTVIESEENGRPIEKSVPWYDWSDCEQTAVYLHEDTVDAMDDFKFDVDGHLRRAYDVRNVETRELDDAIITAVLQKMTPEEIANIIVEERGYSP